MGSVMEIEMWVIYRPSVCRQTMATEGEPVTWPQHSVGDEKLRLTNSYMDYNTRTARGGCIQ